MRDDRLYLRNIFECIERIESYTCDGKKVFLQTTIIQDAVIRNFEIIGVFEIHATANSVYCLTSSG